MVAEEVLTATPYPGIRPRALYLVLPVVTMVGAIVAGILITGRRGSSPEAGLWEMIQASSGSTAVLWAVLASLAVLAVIALGPCRMSGRVFIDLVFKGMGGMIPVVSLLLLAFALGGVVRELGTGAYVAEIIGGAASAKVAVAGSFVLASFMAFATGTSWGTFALMVPIAVPLAAAQGGSAAPLPCCGPGRRGLRRPLFADLGYHHHLVDGFGVGSHGPRADPDSLRPPRRRGCRPLLSHRELNSEFGLPIAIIAIIAFGSYEFLVFHRTNHLSLEWPERLCAPEVPSFALFDSPASTPVGPFGLSMLRWLLAGNTARRIGEFRTPLETAGAARSG